MVVAMQHKIGVVDIGSNSVRLVVFDGLKHAPLPLLNEKVLCGLARDLDSTGVLYAPGVALALKALKRFAVLVKAMKVKDLTVFATSAVRDAKDGKNFITTIEKECGFKIRLLSGEEEARFAAYGISSSFYEAHGVVADMGGGSLELSHIESTQEAWKKKPDQVVLNPQSFPVGALRLKTASGDDLIRASEVVSKAIAPYPLRTVLSDRTLYAVGGGFRALAKVHIQRKKYPLNILHHYTVDAVSMMETLSWVMASDADTLVARNTVSRERLDTVKLSAVVLERLIAEGRPEKIMFSVSGVREGIVFDRLSGKQKASDPLIECCAEMVRHISPNSSDEWISFGAELYDWTANIFRTETDEIKRLRHAACILSHLAWYEHTAYRAEMAFRWIMDSSIPALSHEERAFVAFAVYHRYRAEQDPALTGVVEELLDPATLFRARVAGLALQIGHKISGGACGILPHTSFAVEGKNTLCFSMDKDHGLWLGASTIRRMERLAQVAKLKLVMKGVE